MNNLVKKQIQNKLFSMILVLIFEINNEISLRIYLLGGTTLPTICIEYIYFSAMKIFSKI